MYRLVKILRVGIFVFIFFLLLIIYGVLIEFYRRSWNQLPEIESATASEGEVRISVVVAVRNEDQNITRLINSLLAQDYSFEKFEIIVVDDHSTDNTLALIHDLASKDVAGPKIRVLQSAQEGKKNAIAAGVGAASGELIVTTDGDCSFPHEWLGSLAAFYIKTNAAFIAAPVALERGTTLLSVFQTLDFITLQGITGAAVSKKFNAMCNGANLAYPKNIFEEVNGFDGIDRVPTGDDMLLMHKIQQRYPDKIQYLKSRAAIVTTRPEETWRKFFQQRIRWASKATIYDDKKTTYILFLVYFFNLCFPVMGLLCIFHPSLLFLFMLFLLAKTIIEYPFVNNVAAFFRQQKLMKYFIALQPLHIIYILLSGLLGTFSSYEWKGRKIKTAL